MRIRNEHERGPRHKLVIVHNTKPALPVADARSLGGMLSKGHTERLGTETSRAIEYAAKEDSEFG